MQVPSITVTDRPLPMEVAPEMIRDVMDSGVGEPVKLMYRTGVGNLIVGESTGPLNSIATLKKEDIRMRTKSNTAPFPCRPPAPMPPLPHPLSASCRMREARHEADTPAASHDCRLTAIRFTLIEFS